ncbi:hypothetical protein ACRAQ7_13310 [Erythrobacter sp. W53]|uniref:hypothetical protein n=1 Tax=Erythrobacter sp. W53 TaxID=3425947 RepID=UPI003D7688D3
MLTKWWRRYLKWRLRNVRKLEFDETSFSVLANSVTTSMRWTDIETVYAYKQDLISYDQICLTLVGGGKELTVYETMDGYSQFRSHMEKTLGIDPEWIFNVMTPPFDTNLTRIYPLSDTAED